MSALLAQTVSVSGYVEASTRAYQLRDYQADAIENIRGAFRGGKKRVLLASPTGSGKTVVFSFIVSETLRRQKRIMILVHRDEFIRQISRALEAMGVEFGVIATGYPGNDAPVQIASVQTLARRLDQYLEPVDLIVCDEAHHAVAGSWRKIVAAFPSAFILGVTATPERLDGVGLGDVFDEMVLGPDVAKLITEGWLSPFTLYAPANLPDLGKVKIRAGDYAIDDLSAAMSDDAIVGDAVEHYRQLAHGKPAIAFCVDIAHSKATAEKFLKAGYRAAHVDGETPDREREDLIAALGDGRLDVLSNCGLVSEGLDVPGVGAIVMLRPTKSLALYLQMVGRALRPGEGKDQAIILDHAGNCFRHGLPDDPRQWSLQSTRRRAAKNDQAPVKRCYSCCAVMSLGTRQCPACGYIFSRRVVNEKAGRLAVAERQEAELSAAVIRTMAYRDLLRWAGNSKSRLRRAARIRGYDKGWVWHRLRELGTGAAA